MVFQCVEWLISWFCSSGFFEHVLPFIGSFLVVVFAVSSVLLVVYYSLSCCICNGFAFVTC